jgi:hypothetical protein
VNCLSFDELLLLALPGRTMNVAALGGKVQAHVQECGGCAARLEELRTQFDRVGAAHAVFEHGHAAARERLLRALPERPGVLSRPVRRWRIAAVLAMPQRRRLVGALVAALLGLVFSVTWLALPTPVAFADVAKALLQARSCECRLRPLKKDGGEEVTTTTVYWIAGGAIRLDTWEEDRVVDVRIFLPNEPGLVIDHKSKSYTRTPPQRLPLLLLDELAHYSGQADRDLGESRVAGKRVWGFEIALAKIDSAGGDDVVRVWADTATKKPVKVELLGQGQGESGRLLLRSILEDFRWDVATEGWFRVVPPASYKDKTPAPPTVEQQTKEFIEALQIYVRYYQRYPQALVYGDVADRQLRKAAGVPDQMTLQPTLKEVETVTHVLKGGTGMARMQAMQGTAFDARYYGRTVSPQDGGKVLFRWRLESGEYRVIYGDLRAETVTAEVLRKLEGR